MDQLSEAQKPLGEQIMKISSVGIGGPYNPLMRSPVLGQRLFDLFHYLRWETSVPTRLNEFAILIIGRQWRSQVEWYAHAPLAAKAGLKADIIAELKEGRRPSNMAEDEAVVYDFVTELTSTQKVRDETYARAKKVFNDQQIVDLTAVAGNYVHGGDDPGDGGRNRTARQGTAVQDRERSRVRLPTFVMASWFETRGVAALLTMGVSNLILRRRETPSRRMRPRCQTVLVSALALASLPMRPRWVKPNPAEYFRP